jgi:iron complex transport system ATP-binding protein
METLLAAIDLEIGYRNFSGTQRPLAQGINLTLRAGELIALMGPNGVGKSTLIRTMARLQPMIGGDIQVGGKSVRHLSYRESARLLSIVLSVPPSPGLISVFDLVAMGRYPHTGWTGKLDARHRAVVEWAIENTGIGHLRHRPLHHLSDGERQKVMIARALAQDTPLILLDEPTAHLDLPNRSDIVGLLRHLTRQTQRGILLSTHDLELALQAADRLWLMDHKGRVVTGTPEDLALDGWLGRLFGSQSVRFDEEHGGFRLVRNYREKVLVAGEGPARLWTCRALNRCGYETVSRGHCGLRVSVVEAGGGREWHLERAAAVHRADSIGGLLALIGGKGGDHD